MPQSSAGSHGSGGSHSSRRSLGSPSVRSSPSSVGPSGGRHRLNGPLSGREPQPKILNGPQRALGTARLLRSPVADGPSFRSGLGAQGGPSGRESSGYRSPGRPLREPSRRGTVVDSFGNLSYRSVADESGELEKPDAYSRSGHRSRADVLEATVRGTASVSGSVSASILAPGARRREASDTVTVLQTDTVSSTLMSRRGRYSRDEGDKTGAQEEARGDDRSHGHVTATFEATSSNVGGSEVVVDIDRRIHALQGVLDRARWVHLAV